MSEHRERKRKQHITIKENTLLDKLSGMGDIAQGRSKKRAAVDSYTPSMPYAYDNTKVDYPDVSVLNRPLDMPRSVRSGLLIFLAIAAAIGALALFRYFDVVVNAPAREAAQVIENVTKNVSYDLPILLDLAPLDDTEMMAEISSSNDTLFERTPVGTNEEGGFQVVKLPEGVSIADAAAIYLAGFKNVSAVSASHLLNGAWNLTVTREAPYSLLLRYADFSSHSIENAIQNALLAEMLDNAEETESGVDEAGNTFVAGIVSKDDVTYQWRISVIPLSEVYEIKGLPEDSLYVGIRMTETDDA